MTGINWFCGLAANACAGCGAALQSACCQHGCSIIQGSKTPLHVISDLRAQDCQGYHLRLEQDAGLGACCTHGIGMQPADAVVGQCKPIVLDCGQRRIGYGNHCTRKSLPVPCAWKYRVEDNPVRHAMGPA